MGCYIIINVKKDFEYLHFNFVVSICFLRNCGVFKPAQSLSSFPPKNMRHGSL